MKHVRQRSRSTQQLVPIRLLSNAKARDVSFPTPVRPPHHLLFTLPPFPLQTSRSAAVGAVSKPLWAPLLRADFSESERRELSALTLPPCSSLDRPYHHRKRGWSSSTSCGNGHIGSGGGGCSRESAQEEGRLWRCYGELERQRRKREAKRKARAQERSRTMQLMAFMGRRSRAPYPAGLPRGPYHTPGPPVFPGYDWGAGIGDNADVSPLSPPSSVWGRGGGGRLR